MRVATWNINGVRARMDYIKHWLEARKPDLVGFQEIKAMNEAFPTDAFNDIGYQVHLHGQKGRNGVAFATTLDVDVTQRGLPGHDADGSRLIVGKAENLTFASVYCPNGKDIDHPDYQMKLGWLSDLSDFCARQVEDGQDFLIGGDYNVVRTALDSHYGANGDGKIFHTKEERGVLEKLFNVGLVDLYRHKYPESDAFSWWDYRSGGFRFNKGLRIDLLLGTQGIVDRMTDVVIDRDYRKKLEGLTASDHAPVFVDLS
ncbi:MAG: exodeoxyribonuclease III [Gammaproteobacteria bacterium]|nr:exodeoxyribonuclease III [Gammaproteobacteria bacterium]